MWNPFDSSRSNKPRILLLADKRAWAYDHCAHSLIRHLGDHYAFDLRYVRDNPRLNLSSYDLLYVYFWGEDYHLRFPQHGVRVIKEVSSHRWEDDPRYGPCTPAAFADKYLADATAVICTSQRLFGLLQGVRPELHHVPNGYDERLFRDLGRRSGGLVIGWAGNRADQVKRVAELLEPAAMGYRLITADGKRSRRRMNVFYNDIDVYAIASHHEGTPLPLLEAMAAGCFPVCTDVGVVPEIIVHGENGLIVEPTPEAFRRAFAWCRDNLAAVRAAGARNATLIQSRSFGRTSQVFGDILQHVVSLPRPKK
ncbi:glycosyltransferase family 4 protein [Oryzomonas japonica]|uniref:Glycosyltransferase family 4 protein n=1 Tax=Oryzomonas japonica TaxID=2603858 RepID=A0A7J4ZQU6_9BACT|nr:glycosyltransferase family 4 protein [Oryzomonas japonica]KAB0664861.1 glycosyltransferase family 4 protein [Oryzomonas japonica]